jgi:hypothetical protein
MTNFVVEELAKDLFYFPALLSFPLQINLACELVERRKWQKEARDYDKQNCYTQWLPKNTTEFSEGTSLFTLSVQLKSLAQQVDCKFSPDEIRCLQYEESRGISKVSHRWSGWRADLVLGCAGEFWYEVDGKPSKIIIKSGDIILWNCSTLACGYRNVKPGLPHPRLAEYFPTSMLVASFGANSQNDDLSLPLRTKMYSRYPAATAGRESKGITKDSLVTSGFRNVPVDVLLLIFSYIPYSAISRCRRVCWNWNYVLSLPSSWKQIYILQEGVSTWPPGVIDDSPKTSYENLFRQKLRDIPVEEKIVFDLGSKHLRIGIAGNDLLTATFRTETWAKSEKGFDNIFPIQKTRVTDIYALENVMSSVLESSCLPVTYGILTNHGINEPLRVRGTFCYEFSQHSQRN